MCSAETIAEAASYPDDNCGGLNGNNVILSSEADVISKTYRLFHDDLYVSLRIITLPKECQIFGWEDDCDCICHDEPIWKIKGSNHYNSTCLNKADLSKYSCTPGKSSDFNCFTLVCDGDPKQLALNQNVNFEYGNSSRLLTQRHMI
jgi:hypothetical protein